MKNLQCLVIQTHLFWSDAEANRQHLESIVRSHDTGFDVAVFPETFTSGYLGDSRSARETMEGKTVMWMKALARELGSVLCGSVAIDTADGRSNRFLWVQPDGHVQYYDKRHLFTFAGEHKRYLAGSTREVFNYRGWRICPQVCYDLRFPVWCRNRDDYDVLLVVANWPEPRTGAWSALLKARAIENQCYVIGVNRSGTDPRGMVYTGASIVHDPLGETVRDMGAEEGSAVVTIDLDTVARIRKELPFQRDADNFSL